MSPKNGQNAAFTSSGLAGFGRTKNSPRIAAPPMRWLKREELLGRELAVGELGAEEQRHQRPDVERPEDERQSASRR